MASNYLVVHKKILPNYLDKVIYARQLLENNQVSTITAAVKKAGISRNTYYKYKDYVFSYDQPQHSKQAIIHLVLLHEAGALSSVLTTLSQSHVSIMTISQSIPLNNRASITISLDISSSNKPMEQLLKQIKKIKSVVSVSLEAMQ